MGYLPEYPNLTLLLETMNEKIEDELNQLGIDFGIKSYCDEENISVDIMEAQLLVLKPLNDCKV